MSSQDVQNVVEGKYKRLNIVIQQIHKCNLLRTACHGHGQCKNRFITQLIHESTELLHIMKSLIDEEIFKKTQILFHHQSVFYERGPAFFLPFQKALSYYVHWLREIINVTPLSDFRFFMKII